MYRVRLKLLIILVLSYGCHRLDNGADADLLQCGEPIPPGKRALLWAGDPSQVRAYQAMSNGDLEPVAITKKGCVFVDPARRTFVRSIDSKSSAVLDPYQDAQNLKVPELKQHGTRSIQLQCPANNRVTKLMTMESLLSASSVRDQLKIHLWVNGSSRRLTSVTESIFRQFDKDGLYEMRGEVEDLLSGGIVDVKCAVVLDTLAPDVSLPLNISLPSQINRFDPLSFSIQDADPAARVEYCFLPESMSLSLVASCPLPSLLVAAGGESIALVSQKGRWRLLYRGVDSLGNSGIGWQVTEPILVLDRKAINSLHLSTDRFRYVTDWKFEEIDDLIEALVSGIEVYEGFGSEKEKSEAANSLIPYLFKANSLPLVKTKKVNLEKPLRQMWPDMPFSGELLSTVRGRGDTLVLAIGVNDKSRVIEINPHNLLVNPVFFEFEKFGAVGSIKFGNSVFAFFSNGRVYIADFEKNFSYIVENPNPTYDYRTLRTDEEQGFFMIQRQGANKLYDLLSHETFDLPVRSGVYIEKIVRRVDDNFVIYADREMARCDRQFRNCSKYGTFQAQIGDKNGKIVYAIRFGKLFIDGESLRVYDFDSDKLKVVSDFNTTIKSLFLNNEGFATLYGSSQGKEISIDYSFETERMNRNILPLDLQAADIEEIDYRSARYALVTRKQGMLSAPSGVSIFDTFSQKNLILSSGKHWLSDNMRWIYRSDSLKSFDYEIIALVDQKSQEIKPSDEVNLDRSFTHMGDRYITNSLGQTSIFNFDKKQEIKPTDENHAALFEVFQAKSNPVSIKIKEIELQFDVWGDVLQAQDNLNYERGRFDYPLVSFKLNSDEYIYDFETHALYPGGQSLTQHYFKTAVGIQAYEGVAVTGQSLGPLSRSGDFYFGQLNKISGTDLILGFDMRTMKIMDSKTLRPLVSVDPKNQFFYRLTMDASDPSKFVVMESGRTVDTVMTSELTSKIRIWPIDLSVSALIKEFCQQLKIIRHPQFERSPSCQKD